MQSVSAAAGSSRTSAPDSVLVRRALESLDSSKVRKYAFVERPLLYGAPESDTARRHSAEVVRAARLMLPGPGIRGRKLMLSHVRDSADVKVLHVLTSTDSVSPGYGSAFIREIVMNRQGTQVLASRMAMGETFVTPTRLKPSRQ